MYNDDEIGKSTPDLEVMRKADADIADALDRKNAQRENMEQDLKFAGLCQWEPKDKQARTAMGKPSITKDLTRKMIDKVVNPFRLNPISPIATIDDGEQLERITYKAVAEDVWKKATQDSGAAEVGFEHGMTCGVGYMHLRSTYVDNEGYEQQLAFEEVPSPLHVILDPNSTEQDGSDAEWGAIVSLMSKRQASGTYGQEVLADGAYTFDMGGKLKIPEDSVAEVLYYWREYESIERTFFKDGSFDDSGDEVPPEERDNVVHTRTISVPKVYVCKIVGNKVVHKKSPIPISYIPLFPFYGDSYFDDSMNRMHMGVIRRVADTQREINFSASTSVEIQNRGLTAQYIMYEDEYPEDDNGNPLDSDALDREKTIVLKPRAGNSGFQRLTFDSEKSTAQNNKTAAMQDMQEQLGIHDSSMGKDGGFGGAQSGRAIDSLSANSDITIAKYTDNLVRTIKHADRVVLEYAQAIYTYPVNITVGTETKQLIPSEVLNGRKPDIIVESGPIQESQRERGISALKEIGALLGPERGVMVVPAMLKMRNDVSVDPLIKKLEAEFGLGDEVGLEDPQAVAQLEEASQIIDQQKMVNQQLEAVIEQQNEIISAARTKIISNKDKLQNNIQIEIIKGMNTIKNTLIKEDSSTERTAMEIEADYEAQVSKMIEGVMGKQMESFVPDMPNMQMPVDKPLDMGGTGVPIYTKPNFFKRM